jgi:hypothetical protein
LSTQSDQSSDRLSGIALEQIAHRLKLGGQPSSLPDAVYVIECPSPEDALEGRGEGETLARTLKLAGIAVHYHLALNEEMVDAAFDKVSAEVRSRSDWAVAMPWVHLSAHGCDEGLEMSDGTLLYWGVLSRMLETIHNRIGPVLIPEEYNQNLPKSSLALSSCSAFQNFVDKTSKPLVQCVVGAVRDVGWCQSLIAFSTFYYHEIHLDRSVMESIYAMNVAAGDYNADALFKFDRPHVAELDE